MSYTPENPKYPEETPLEVKRGRVNSVSLYEVKENELEILEHGDSNGVYLNFAIFLFSLAFSAIATIATATFNKPIYQTLFLIVIVVGILLGLILLLIWNKGRKALQQVIVTIKNRIPPDALMQADKTNLPKTQ